MAKINAYRVDTGEKVRIPEHWLDDPTLGKPFRKTPAQRARDTEKTGPTPGPKTAGASGTGQKGK